MGSDRSLHGVRLLLESIERRDGHLAQQITQEYVYESFRELEQQICGAEREQ